MEDISLSVDLSFIEIVSETQEPVLERFQELFSMYLSFVCVNIINILCIYLCFVSVGFLDSINMQMNKCFILQFQFIIYHVYKTLNLK